MEVIYSKLLNEDDGDYKGLALTPGILKRLSVATLHRLVAADALPERLEAIRWELTRRQGLPTLYVAWAAFAVSVLALAVSIIWHD
jgi:hypothetical protein